MQFVTPSEFKSGVDGLAAFTRDALGEFKADCKSDIARLRIHVEQLGAQLHRPDAGGGRTGGSMFASSGLKELKNCIIENKSSLEKHGRVAFEVASLLPEGKSTILSTGITSTEPAAGIQGAGRFAFRLRTMFRVVPTTSATIGVLRSTTETLSPSMQVEGMTKAESTLAFALVQVPVQTLATWVNFSKQALDDVDQFESFLNATLVWALEKKAEQEILTGDGTGVHLPGLVTGGTAFDTSIVSGTWTRADILGAAAVQLVELGYSPDFACVSPRNWFKMVSLRSTTGEYVLNDPRTATGEHLYALNIYPTPSITGDTFLVGDSSKAIIRERQKTTVELSFETGSNWTTNSVTARAETRFAIEKLRPDAFVTGALTSAP